MKALATLVVLAATVALPRGILAAVIPFVASPTTNSTDWTTAVTGLGATINTNVNFDAHPTGVLQNGFYTASDGVTFATTGPITTVTFGAGPADGNTGSGPLSSGEGPHAASNFLLANNANNGGPSTLTISFNSPVAGAGFFVIDLFNPGSQPSTRNPIQIEAFTGPGGTGTSLGIFDAPQFNFQNNNQLFLGIVSTAGDIGSIRLHNPGAASDRIGVDDIRFALLAQVPEPASILMWSALGLVGVVTRRRRLRVSGVVGL